MARIQSTGNGLCFEHIIPRAIDRIIKCKQTACAVNCVRIEIMRIRVVLMFRR